MLAPFIFFGHGLTENFAQDLAKMYVNTPRPSRSIRRSSAAAPESCPRPLEKLLEVTRLDAPRRGIGGGLAEEGAMASRPCG